MKKIANLKVGPYFTLPNGETITFGGSTVVLNKNILESLKVKKAKEKGLINIIEDDAEPSAGDNSQQII